MKDGKRILERVLAFLLPMVFVLVLVLIVLMWFKSGTASPAVRQQEQESETVPPAVDQTEETKSTETEPDNQDTLINEMTLAEKVAQMFIVTPEALTGVDSVAAAGEATKTAFDERPVGGIIYFDNNIQAEEQLRTMLADMKAISQERIGIPPFLSVDEEGARVVRIAGQEGFQVDQVSSMLSIGQTGDVQKAYEAGAYIGSYLKGYGFNLDYAPVADVIDTEENAVIGDRSFGTDPETAAGMVAEAVKGFKSEGILTSLKHFPGHGATAEDSHEGFATSTKSAEELESFEFLPFKAGIEAGAEMVMVGHISLPNVTGDNTPSSLSETVVSGLLREKLGYNGIVITDALNMGAISANYESADAAVRAIQAGVDILLMPADFTAAYQGVMDAVAAGDISEERINESVSRILNAKNGL